MKKALAVFIAIGGVAVIVAVICLFPHHAKPDDASVKRRISNTVADVSNGSVEKYINTHGGFLGDGETYIKISFDNKKCLNSITNNRLWKPFPLTQDIKTALWGREYTVGDTEISEGPLISNEEGIVIPAIKNGYYCFIDRTEGKNELKRTADRFINVGYSYNFTISIYDTDTDSLYYYELDT
jgi:hypothetical protein